MEDTDEISRLEKYLKKNDRKTRDAKVLEAEKWEKVKTELERDELRLKFDRKAAAEAAENAMAAERRVKAAAAKAPVQL